jgi:hypothetical protein
LESRFIDVHDLVIIIDDISVEVLKLELPIWVSMDISNSKVNSNLLALSILFNLYKDIKFSCLLTNLTITSLRIAATRSLSYSQDMPTAPRDTLTDLTFLGTFFESGEMLLSFWGKAKRPDDKKSR